MSTLIKSNIVLTHNILTIEIVFSFRIKLKYCLLDVRHTFTQAYFLYISEDKLYSKYLRQRSFTGTKIYFTLWEVCLIGLSCQIFELKWRSDLEQIYSWNVVLLFDYMDANTVELLLE